tara:strand:+ start:178 stop:417 length:240 start_codon:yes stop_codon:yes gene_type:complete
MTRLQRRQLRKRKYKLSNDKSINYENLLGHSKAFDPILGEYVRRDYFIIKTTSRTKMIDVREKEMLSREVTSTPLYPWQ